MNVLRRLIAIITAVALAFSVIGAGFLVCTVPPVTNMLANYLSDDVTSPFSRSQLVKVADATRDYSFGAHDLKELYKTIYEVDLDLRQSIIVGNGSLPVGFPQLDSVKDRENTDQIAAAFSGASEMYCYSKDTIAHLDDCFALAQGGRVVLAIAAIIGLAGLIACGMLGGKRTVGYVFLGTGITVLSLFVAFGVFAAIDFTRFFALFHQLFFSQGNWEFPYDSLLICALPTAFWIGMAITWLATSVLISILSIAIGSGLTKHPPKAAPRHAASHAARHY
jgi:hypothetical protein